MEKKFKDFYPHMRLQCNRQNFPGATFFTNATLIVPDTHSCFEFAPMLKTKLKVPKGGNHGEESEAS
jgi:hypothetical protein